MLTEVMEEHRRVLLVHGVVELSDALMSPVFPKLGQNVTEHI